MPLIKSTSKQAFGENIKREMAAGNHRSRQLLLPTVKSVKLGKLIHTIATIQAHAVNTITSTWQVI